MSPNLTAAMRALPVVWATPRRVAANGVELAPAVEKPLSHFLGSDRVAIALAGAHLADTDQCITAVNLSRYCGQSRSTVGGKLRLMPRWFSELPSMACNASQWMGERCPANTKHYAFSIPR